MEIKAQMYNDEYKQNILHTHTHTQINCNIIFGGQKTGINLNALNRGMV